MSRAEPSSWGAAPTVPEFVSSGDFLKTGVNILRLRIYLSLRYLLLKPAGTAVWTAEAQFSSESRKSIYESQSIVIGEWTQSVNLPTIGGILIEHIALNAARVKSTHALVMCSTCTRHVNDQRYFKRIAVVDGGHRRPRRFDLPVQCVVQAV